MEAGLGLFSGYYPGYLEQDLITIPLEAVAVGGLSLISMKGREPAWPFDTEAASFPKRNSSRHPKSVLVPAAGVMGFISVGSLAVTSPEYPLWLNLRGFVHAHLANEFLTSLAKVSFARKRPFYDGVKARGEHLREDDLKSFFSGHSSHAFTFASYSTSMIFRYSENPILNYSLATVFASSAVLIGGARYADGQHNLSDVIVGALVGTATGLLMENRVAQVHKILNSEKNSFDTSTQVKNKFSAAPGILRGSQGASVPSLNIRYSF
jgi:membrane-associated phospholipid phosphatase